MSEKWVTIELSRKQVDASNLVHNDKTQKDYARIIGPGGGSYLYPIDGIKVDSENPDKLFFVRPERTEIQVSYGHRVEGVPDSASNDEKYANETRTFLIEDLKAAYEDDKRAFAEANSPFVNMIVPTEWAWPVASRPDLLSISVPVDKVYYSFLVSKDHFKPSSRDEGMSYFGFPKKKKDSEEDYTITLKHGDKQADDSYVNTEKVVSSVELKKIVDDAVSRADFKDKLVSVGISNKLIKPFTSSEGKSLYNVSVPFFVEPNSRFLEPKEVFYHIVVSADRVKDLGGEKVYLNLFKKGPDGNDFNYTAKLSEKQSDGTYADVDEKTFTSVEVVSLFNESKSRYIEKNFNKEHSLADELKINANQVKESSQSYGQVGGQPQQPFRRHAR